MLSTRQSIAPHAWRGGIAVLCALLLALPIASGGQSPRPLREIAFTTSSGTWMSLDVSPNGQTIVFELLGDLHAVPISGGATVALTRGSAFDAMPRFSPDGRTLAFVSDRDGGDNIWLMNADGSSPRQLTRERRKVMLSPTFTPDGKSVLATVTVPGLARTAELWRFDTQTGVGARVLENRAGAPSMLNATPAPGPYGATVTPDARTAITAMVTPRAYGVRAGAATRLLRLDLASGRVDPLPVDGALAVAPQLSPDGTVLAYGSQFRGVTGIRLRELATGHDRILVPRVDQDELESRATRDLLPRFAFTPDGRELVIGYGGAIHRVRLSDGRDTVVPFTATVQATVPEPPRVAERLDTSAVTARVLAQPAISNSGRLAVSAFAQIWITDAAGLRPRRLTSRQAAREYYPAWSPDSRRVAYTTWGADGGGLWVTSAEGSAEPVRVETRSAFYADPAFSPDGRHLVALRAPEGTTRRREGPWPSDAELIVVSIDSGRVRTLGPAGALRQPRWSADGTALLAFAPSTGVVRIDVATGERMTRASYRDIPRFAAFGAPKQGVVLGNGGSVVVQEGDSLLRAAAVSVDGASVLEPRRGTVWSADAPEGVGLSPDGLRVAWTTGRWVHRVRLAADTIIARDSVELSIRLPRAVGRGTVVLRGVTVVTMVGNQVVRDADLVIRDGRIVSVGARGAVPAGARVFDLPGHTVVPGYVDVHAHWFVSAGLLEPDVSAPMANLAYGITTARDPSAPVDVFAYADMAAAGIMPSARLLSTGPGLFPDRDPATPAAAQALVRRYRDRYRTSYLKMYMAGDRQQRQWIADAAASNGILATTEGGSDLRQNLTHVLDGYAGHEHAYPATPLGNDAVQWLARSRIAYTPTLLVAFGGPLPIYGVLAKERPAQDPVLQRWMPADELYRRTATRGLWFDADDYRDASQARDAAAVHRAGGLVAVGSHGEVQGLSFHWEMELLAKGGLTPHEILRMATANGTEALGLQRDLGTIEPGKVADVVVLSRDPLMDIRNARQVRYVMRDGELFEAATLARVWPSSAPAPQPWWRREATTNPTADLRAVDSTVQQLMAETNAPGVALAVVRRGTVLVSKGYGLADLEQQTPVTDQTMFQSGSMAKQFTAAGVLALVDDGRLQLDQSVRRVLPEVPATWEGITIRHLLTHSAGIPDYTSATFDFRRDWTEAELLSLATAMPLEFPPGARWNYSNTGYVVLGIVIGRVTGQPYWTYLRERIFTPAGMPTIRVQTDSAIVPHRAAGYEPAGTDWRRQRWVAPLLNTTADGSMLLSLRDMLAWNDVVRRRAVLSDSAWRAMFTPMTLASGRPYPYGFAWFADSAAGAPLWQHGGAWQGFRTQYSRFSAGDLDIIVLANARTTDPEAIANAVAMVLEPSLAPPARRVLPETDAQASTAVRRFLARAIDGSLSPDDFVHMRQTIVPRAIATLTRTFAGLGTPKLELLVSGTRGDDRRLTYRASFAVKVFELDLYLSPDGRVTDLRLRPLADRGGR